MRFITKVLSVCIALFSLTLAVNAQQPQISFIVENKGPEQLVTMNGNGLSASENVFLTTKVVSGGCKYNQLYIQTVVAVTSSVGTFEYVDRLMCDAVIQYEVIVGTQVFFNNVQLGSTLAAAPISNCQWSSSLSVGMTVATTRNVAGWMLPSFGPESHNGKPLFNFETGKQLQIVEGPVCNETGMWWHVSNQYSFLRNGTWVPTETVSWVQDTINSSHTLFHDETMATGEINYPQLSTRVPQAVSVLSVQGQRVLTVPSITSGKRVAALKRQDGAVTVAGTNANGAFVKVILSNGAEGWTCSAFLVTNVSLSTIPVIDNSSEVCFK